MGVVVPVSVAEVAGDVDVPLDGCHSGPSGRAGGVWPGHGTCFFLSFFFFCAFMFITCLVSAFDKLYMTESMMQLLVRKKEE